MQLYRIILKFKKILRSSQKQKIAILTILMIIGGFLEMASVSLILPFMNIVMNADDYMKEEWIAKICDILGIYSSNSFLFLLALIIAMLFLLKNVYLLFEYNIQYKFVYSNMLEMQNRLLSSFVHRPYEYFLGVNSGEIIRAINSDVPNAFSALMNILTMFTEMVVSAMIITSVFAAAPLVTILTAALLLVLVIIVNCIVRPLLRGFGEKAIESSSEMNKWLLQSIHGIKEIKVMSKENFFEKRFNEYGCIYVNSVRKQQVISVIPRFFIEGVGMFGMFIAVSVFIYKGTSVETLLPIISAIALAAMRILPSINRITLGMSNLSYSEPMIDKLLENLSDIEGYSKIIQRDNRDDGEIKTELKDFSSDISLNNITYQYPDSDKPVLLGSNIRIEKGESIGIVGPSGAGKSTTVDVLLGLLRPSSGMVLVDGMDIAQNRRSFLRQVGYIPQSIFILDDSIKANIAFGEDNVSEEAIWKAVKDAALYDFVMSLPDGLETKIGERGVRLSGGQRQRIGIARALYHNPSILVLDEATSALDNETEKAIMESIDNLRGQKTLIIIAHRLTTIEKCDSVYQVENGEICRKK